MVASGLNPLTSEAPGAKSRLQPAARAAEARRKRCHHRRNGSPRSRTGECSFRSQERASIRSSVDAMLQTTTFSNPWAGGSAARSSSTRCVTPPPWRMLVALMPRIMGGA